MRLMRALFAIVLLAALPGCTPANTPAPDASANEPAPLIGAYRAASDTARQRTGDIAIERGGLVFAKGIILYTRALNPRRGYELTAREGDSYAALAVGPGELNVELRRISEQVLPHGVMGLCGADAPSYAALAYEARAASVTLMVFSGDEPPGPQATQSRLCGAFAYLAPDGVRTRQGVALQ